MRINCLIVDDEPLSRDVLATYVNDHPDLELTGICKDAFEAMEQLEKTSADLILLDVNMPKLSGVNLYKSLEKKPQVVFTTAYPEYAVEGFELNATDYLLKPFSFERFVQAINKVKAKLPTTIASSEDDYIMLKADKKMYKVNYDDLLYVEALGDYVKVHTKQKVLITNDTLKSLLEVLPQNQFIRTHKSYLISTSQLEYIEGNQVKIGEAMIPIGQSHRERVLRFLQKKSE